MIGIRTPDQAVFLADCVSSEKTLEKYQITFIYDVAEYLRTLDLVEEMKGEIFVPSHAEASSSVRELVQANRSAVLSVAEKIQALLETPCTFEVLLQQIFRDYGLTMNFEQYVLIGSTVRSYLSWLKDQGKITAVFENNLLLWSRC